MREIEIIEGLVYAKDEFGFYGVTCPYGFHTDKYCQTSCALLSIKKDTCCPLINVSCRDTFIGVLKVK